MHPARPPIQIIAGLFMIAANIGCSPHSPKSLAELQPASATTLAQVAKLTGDLNAESNYTFTQTEMLILERHALLDASKSEVLSLLIKK